MNMRPGTQRCYDLSCSGGVWGCKKCDKARFHALYRHLEPYKRDQDICPRNSSDRTDDYNFGNHDAASHIGGDCVWVSFR
jgi:hypothetical protein